MLFFIRGRNKLILKSTRKSKIAAKPRIWVLVKDSSCLSVRGNISEFCPRPRPRTCDAWTYKYFDVFYVEKHFRIKNNFELALLCIQRGSFGIRRTSVWREQNFEICYIGRLFGTKKVMISFQEGSLDLEENSSSAIQRSSLGFRKMSSSLYYIERLFRTWRKLYKKRLYETDSAISGGSLGLGKIPSSQFQTDSK